MSKIVADTSVMISVITDEPSKSDVLRLTRDKEIIAPTVLQAEVGNALSRMFKRKRASLKEAIHALEVFADLPIQFQPINLLESLRLAYQLDIYAYDAYFLDCALRNGAPLITLDHGLLVAAQRVGVQAMEAGE